MRPRWAAVIVNYETGPLLIDCVRSVLADTSAGPVELVVLDNGSRDSSIEVLHAAFPGVRVVTVSGKRRLRACARTSVSRPRTHRSLRC